MTRLSRRPSTPRRKRSTILDIRERISASPKPHQNSKAHRSSKHRWRRGGHRIPVLRAVDRRELAEVSQETVDVILGEGSYSDAESGLTHSIGDQVASSIEKTCLYASSSSLVDIDGPRLLKLSAGKQTEIEILQCSPLKAARDLSRTLEQSKDPGGIGFLNPCSAKRPGGGFLNGGTEKEECLARASTLYASLISEAAAPFYRDHKHDDAAGLYDHQLIYTPHIVIIRADRRPGDLQETGGGPFIPPLHISVVSSCAINAAQLRRHHNVPQTGYKAFNEGTKDVMRSRMAHILRVFEERGIRNLLLCAFGVGQPFYNDIEVVAHIWADLIACPGAIFERVFDRIWFAADVPEFHRFKASFDSRVLEEELKLALTMDEADSDDLEQVDLPS